jgi:phage tail protein X
MKSSPEIGRLASALVAAAPQLRAAKYDKVNPHFRSSYASLSAVIEAVRVVLAEHGITVVQPIDAERSVVETILIHESGEWLAGTTYIVAPEGSSAQQIGSAITYARRYGLAAICAISADDDDDGEAASASSASSATGTASQQQSAPQSAPRAGDEAGGSVATPAQVKRLWAVAAKRFGGDEKSPDWKSVREALATISAECGVSRAWMGKDAPPMAMDDYRAVAERLDDDIPF